MTADDTADAPDTYAGPRCQACGGPCWQHKGSVWGWTCNTCLEQYLDEGAAKAAARDRKDRERLARKALEAAAATNDDNPTASLTANTDQRLEGGPRYVPHPPASIQPERAADRAYVPRRPMITTTREDTL
ncbi:hypothetical protein [Mycobacterium kubicae]|nr:hypothetical protein [Mycobacterium kubicae]MCV7094098.1 hypothetical protein [Mycobacterium kubicae]QNI12540.1 hypothetical protein GAN18_16145 [Mycobacterium kubicae]QPI36065.1 hypothetical protein I2456_15940 [Mycobacterium kubicae]